MKTLISFLILAVALLVGAFLAPQATVTVLAVAALCGGAVYLAANHHQISRRSRLVGAINIADGTHEGSKSYLTDAAVATRWLLAKIGSDAAHSAACGASDIPIGVLTDEAAAAELPIDVELLGISKRTMLMVASAAITAGVAVYTAANGKIQVLPAAAGTYYKVGYALTAAAADGNLVEVQHCTPIATVVT